MYKAKQISFSSLVDSKDKDWNNSNIVYLLWARNCCKCFLSIISKSEHPVREALCTHFTPRKLRHSKLSNLLKFTASNWQGQNLTCRAYTFHQLLATGSCQGNWPNEIHREVLFFLSNWIILYSHFFTFIITGATPLQKIGWFHTSFRITRNNHAYF